MASKKALEQYLLQKIKKPLTFTDEIVRYTTVDGKKFYSIYEQAYRYDSYGYGYSTTIQSRYRDVRIAYKTLADAIKQKPDDEINLYMSAVVTSELYRVKTGIFKQSIKRINKPFLGIGGYYLHGVKQYDDKSKVWRRPEPTDCTAD